MKYLISNIRYFHPYHLPYSFEILQQATYILVYIQKIDQLINNVQRLVVRIKDRGMRGYRSIVCIS
jgi:hypothetical protein